MTLIKKDPNEKPAKVINSFCIYGVRLGGKYDNIEFLRLIKKTFPESYEDFLERREEAWTKKPYYEKSLECLKKIDGIKKEENEPKKAQHDFYKDIPLYIWEVTGFVSCFYVSEHERYLGVEWCKMEDDDRVREWKERIKEQLKLIFLDDKDVDVECQTIERAWESE